MVSARSAPVRQRKEGGGHKERTARKREDAPFNSSACSDPTQQDIGVDLQQNSTMDWDPHQSSRIRNDIFDHDIKRRDTGSPISDSDITA